MLKISSIIEVTVEALSLEGKEKIMIITVH
jgi:hypothetical protein